MVPQSGATATLLSLIGAAGTIEFVGELFVAVKWTKS